MAVAQRSQAHLEFRVSVAPRGQIPQIDQQIHGDVILVRLLGLNEHLDLLPRGLLPPGQLVEISSAGFGRFPLLARAFRGLVFGRQTSLSFG
jgi:hypothetical protein